MAEAKLLRRPSGKLLVTANPNYLVRGPNDYRCCCTTPPTGKCCNTTRGTCTDGVSATQCQEWAAGDAYTYTPGATCANVFVPNYGWVKACDSFEPWGSWCQCDPYWGCCCFHGPYWMAELRWAICMGDAGWWTWRWNLPCSTTNYTYPWSSCNPKSTTQMCSATRCMDDYNAPHSAAEASGPVGAGGHVLFDAPRGSNYKTLHI